MHFRPFSNFDKCRSEVAGDVMSGVAVQYVGGMDVCSTFGESNSDRNTGLFVQPDPFYASLLCRI